MASLTHTQARAVVANQYRVSDTVTAVSSMPAEIFVFSTDDAAFSRVAIVSDLYEYPAGRIAAQTAGKPYYRHSSVSRDFDELGAATEFSVAVKQRVRQLVSAYSAAAASFVGTETINVLP